MCLTPQDRHLYKRWPIEETPQQAGVGPASVRAPKGQKQSMTSGFMQIEMGRALHGDCLFVEWSGEQGSHRMLIDGGPIGAYDILASRLAAQPANGRLFELVVLSHVDADHIEGMLRLFAQPPEQWPLQVKEVWFNGWRHLVEAEVEVLGGRQGEYFSALLQHRLPPGAWNTRFGGRAVVRPDDDLPVVTLDGGMTLTLLSPTRSKLDKMREAWRKNLAPRGLTPGDLVAAWQSLGEQKKYLPEESLLASSSASIEQILQRQFRPDESAANGASIAFLAEHAAGRCLFLADAHPDVIVESLQRLLRVRGLQRLSVDAVKVSHHGSKNNTDEALVSLVDSPRWLVSTSGAIFRHPDEEAIARILDGAQGRPLELYFNYTSEISGKWADPAFQAERRYRAVFPQDDTSPFAIVLGKRTTGA